MVISTYQSILYINFSSKLWNSSESIENILFMQFSKKSYINKHKCISNFELFIIVVKLLRTVEYCSFIFKEKNIIQNNQFFRK